MIGDVLAMVGKPEEIKIQAEGSAQLEDFFAWPISFFSRAESQPDLSVHILVCETYGPTEFRGIMGAQGFEEALRLVLTCDPGLPSFRARAYHLIECLENKIKSQGLSPGEMFLWSTVCGEEAA